LYSCRTNFCQQGQRKIKKHHWQLLTRDQNMQSLAKATQPVVYIEKSSESDPRKGIYRGHECGAILSKKAIFNVIFSQISCYKYFQSNKLI
jgi:hypothetical protein